MIADNRPGKFPVRVDSRPAFLGRRLVDSLFRDKLISEFRRVGDSSPLKFSCKF